MLVVGRDSNGTTSDLYNLTISHSTVWVNPSNAAQDSGGEKLVLLLSMLSDCLVVILCKTYNVK